MRVDFPTSEAAGYPVLCVMPPDHPQQMLLPETERDVAIAERHGAAWVEGALHMRPTRPMESDDTKLLIRKFATKTARDRAERAYAEMPERPNRVAMARAANREVEARGEAPTRPIPAAVPAPEQRIYFFTAREADSPYCYKKLDAALKEAGVAALIDHDRKSLLWGLRYVDAAALAAIGARSEALAFFRTPEAEAAQAESRRARDSETVRVGDAAATAAAAAVPETRPVRPLTVPHPERDPEGFETARKAIRSIGTAKLEALLKATHEARAAIKREEDKLAVLGKELSPKQKGDFGLYTRGIRLAELVLRERQAATHRMSVDVATVGGGREAERDAAASGSSPRQAARAGAARER